MKELTFIGILKISLVMPVLLVLSVILVTTALERWFFFAKNAAINAKLFARIKKAVLAGQVAEAREIAAGGQGLIAEALAAQLLAAPHKNRSEMDHVLTLYFQRIQFMLSRRLWIFGTLSFISPLLGLLGTVLGVMTAFRDLAAAGAGGPTVVAAGISEALVATAAGITVAVSAALVYNYFNVRVKHVLNSLNILGQEITLLVTTGKDI